MVADQIIDHVVTLISLGKIFLGVIDRVVSADRFHQIDIARAANGGHLCAKRLRDLHDKSADAAGRAVDQDFLSGLNVSLVAKTLQCGDTGDRNRAGLFECNVGRFHHDRSIGLDANVIRHCAVLRAENFVVWFEVCDIFPNYLNDTGEIGPESDVFGLAHPSHWTHRPPASDQVAVNRIHRSRADSDENFIVFRCRFFQVAELKITDAIFAIHDSFHGITRGSSVAIAVVSRHPIGDEQTANEHDQD